MTVSVQLFGGPEDGRRFDVPGPVPPPELHVTLEGPLTCADLDAADGPIVTAAAHEVVRYHRQRMVTPAGAVRWCYTFGRQP